jgi:hypothetical protein
MKRGTMRFGPRVLSRGENTRALQTCVRGVFSPRATRGKDGNG